MIFPSDHLHIHFSFYFLCIIYSFIYSSLITYLHFTYISAPLLTTLSFIISSTYHFNYLATTQTVFWLQFQNSQEKQVPPYYLLLSDFFVFGKSSQGLNMTLHYSILGVWVVSLYFIKKQMELNPYITALVSHQKVYI